MALKGPLKDNLVRIEPAERFKTYLKVNNFEESSKALLYVEDLIKIEEKLKISKERVFLHELLENSIINLPENPEIKRNSELEKRCNILRANLLNMEYKNMMNIEDIREKTLSEELKEINQYILGAVQVFLSLITGFVFGYYGINLIIGYLEQETKLLLGLVCSSVIFVAEMYFFIKKVR
ncbi:unnamed protein product [Brassicogethes aeneus]|uniref:Uncharacterized protein n=1 Tax=Brassicogethes aeneus TaxID=1431903 RepID=A0A9P0FGZ3_BRAAE|nr:unnamed protein product [Brassicogethes aeneus]